MRQLKSCKGVTKFFHTADEDFPYMRKAGGAIIYLSRMKVRGVKRWENREKQ